MNKAAILALAATAVAMTAPSLAQDYAPYRIVETGQRFGSLSEAVERIGGGSGTIEVAPGSWRDCAVQTAGNITYRAAQPGQTIFDGGVCEGKATLVLRGRSARIDGIIFQNIGVPDGNGAGIRLEGGNLAVFNSWFRNSEQGILTASDPNGSITIDKSTFTRLGRCDRGLSCAHSIYIGDYGSLNVTRSRFEAGNGGHYVKSRAKRVNVSDSSFDDTRGHTTNYMIDLPNGAVGTITRNTFVQGEDKENYSAFIAVAAEGKGNSSAGLAIAGNDARIAPGVQRSTVFLADWSGDRIALGQNQLGKGLKPFERR